MTIYLLDLIGVAVFAASGALAAGRKSLDLLGVFVIAVVTAIGGGTTRDLLLDRHPIFWIHDPTYLAVISAATLLTILYVRRRPPAETALNLLLMADALGLALFTLLGAQIAEGVGVSPVIIVLMGTITGVVGGVLRDVLSVEVPLILRRDIYATASLAGGTLYLLAEAVGVSRPVAVFLGVAMVAGLRFMAIFHGWRLPVFRLPQEPR